MSYLRGSPRSPGPAGEGGLLSAIASEAALYALCLELGASPEPTLSLRPAARPLSQKRVRELRAAVREGYDPLGDAFVRLRSQRARRRLGATYTPPSIVNAMIAWARRACRPDRVVDPGAGSGRFLLAAARAFPRARLVGVELDPLAAAIARANLAAAGFENRAAIVVADYRSAALPPANGATLFVGNPPYVRHHDISAAWKSWYAREARARDLPPSRLAGLHLHFFLATLARATEGDAGSLITAAEWLDVGYGALARELFATRLGIERLDVIDPRALPFESAQTTAAIASFRVGAAAGVRVRRVRDASHLADLSGGPRVSRDRLRAADRWTPLSRPARARAAEGVELGELFRVHRGQVTGKNRVWIAGPHTPPLPADLLRPAVTRAKELIAAGAALKHCGDLRRVVDLPADLDALSERDRLEVERFLRWAKAQGADRGYIASHRSPWWRVGLRAPAPVLATYMARRPPVFVQNPAGAHHINIAHGLYPRAALSEPYLDALARYLTRAVSTDEGRTYAGGLTKFEPGEIERLRIPPPERLLAEEASAGRLATAGQAERS